MTQNKEEKIKNDYLQGMRYKDIFKKYNITLPDLKKIIRKYNLTRDKSQVLKGNKNAKNNKGGQPPMGNKNAVTTGEYESIFQDVLTDEEKDIFKKIKESVSDTLSKKWGEGNEKRNDKAGRCGHIIRGNFSSGIIVQSERV